LRVLLSPEADRVRRITDVTAGSLSALFLGAVSFGAVPPFGFARTVDDVLGALPAVLGGLWQLSADLLLFSLVGLIIVAALTRRWELARDLVLAVVLAELVHLGVSRVVTGAWPDAWLSFWRTGPPPAYPSGRISVTAAAALVAEPYLSLPIRRGFRALLAVGSIGMVALGAASSLGVLAGLAVAVTSSAAVRLVFGSLQGRPSVAEVSDALAQLGVTAPNLRVAPDQRAGVFGLEGTDDEGRALRVRVYGRDAHDTALLVNLWRRAWFRQQGAPVRLGRLQQVEHEAFATLFAHQAGVPTDRVVAAGMSADHDAVLVLHRTDVPIEDLDEHTRPEPAALWEVLGELRAARISHGSVDDQHLTAGPDGVGLIDFSGAIVGATDDQLAVDEVQALVTTVEWVGASPAIDAAIVALGPERVRDLLPLLQPALLSSRLRDVTRSGQVDLEELRTLAAERLGVELPELRELRRVTIGSIASVVLPAIALVIVVSALVSVDWRELRDEIATATWWLLAVGFVASQLPRLSAAVSLLGASPRPIPLGQAYALQLSSAYLGLAVPTMAGRMALSIRFFQRHGMSAGIALTAGAMDNFSGFVVQVILLVTLLLSGAMSVELDLGSRVPSVPSWFLWGVIAVVGGVSATLVVVPALRQMVIGRVREFISEAAAALRGLRSPRRLGMLLGGNLASELLAAGALGLIAASMGYRLGLAELIVINVGAALFAGLMPVPGGVGVAEGGLTFGLSLAGVPQETAFAIALLSRLSTFYLPPAWGYVALRWLQRNQYV
jgi:uncharacterized membrane protein YbhN (UPF0104 family)